MYLPIGLFGISIGTAALPEISRLAAAADVAAMRRTIAGALRLMLVLNVPATIGLVVLARPVVSLLLERGRFGPDDTAATAAALMCYAPGLVGYSAVKIASPSFYALRDSRTPLVVSVVAVVTNVVLNLTLVRVIGYRGLALGTAIAATLNAGLLLWMLQRAWAGSKARRTGASPFSDSRRVVRDGGRGMADRNGCSSCAARDADDACGRSACLLPSASACCVSPGSRAAARHRGDRRCDPTRAASRLAASHV